MNVEWAFEIFKTSFSPNRNFERLESVALRWCVKFSTEAEFLNKSKTCSLNHNVLPKLPLSVSNPLTGSSQASSTSSKGCKRAQSGYREHRYLKHLPLTAVQGSSVLARAKKENGKSSMTGLSGTKPRNSRIEKTKVIFTFQDDTFEDFRRRWSREGNEDNDLL